MTSGMAGYSSPPMQASNSALNQISGMGASQTTDLSGLHNVVTQDYGVRLINPRSTARLVDAGKEFIERLTRRVEEIEALDGVMPEAEQARWRAEAKTVA